MKPTIYIHAGIHKTGTTAIQSALFRNRRWLRRHGANYLSIGENHSMTLYPRFSDEPHLCHINVRLGVDTVEKAARRNAAIDAALRRDLERNTSPRFVISGEEILSLSPRGTAALKASLDPFAGDIRTIVYVREPYGYINSAFQEMMRNGFSWDHLVLKPPGPMYSRIQKLIDVFGRDHVDIRVYDRARFIDGDLIADFLAAIGLEPRLAKEIKSSAANPSLSHEAVLILAALNTRYPTPFAGRRNPQIDPDIFKILRAVKGRPFQCPPEVFSRLHLDIVRDVAWLNATLGETLYSAEPPPVREPEQSFNEDTLTSLAVLFNELSKDSMSSLRRLRRGGRAAPGLLDDTIWRSLADWLAHRRTI